MVAVLVCAISAAPASAIMVKLPTGGYANYDAIKGAKAPHAAQIFDLAFTNLDYSGGPVMPSNTNYVVEWQPSNYSGTAFQGTLGYAHDYVGGVAQFFQDLAAGSRSTSIVDAVSGQYNDTTGATSGYNAGYGGKLVDTDPLPANGCPANPGDICITDAQIQAELNSFLASQHVPADFTHEYFLLTPPDVASCFDSAGHSCSANADQSAQFCAYHSQTGQGYIYSNIPDLSGLSGCDPFATDGYSYDNGPGDGMISAISHEHNESITDPQPNNAWTDWGSSVGGEIGDKCNFDADQDPNTQFGSSFDNPYNQVINNDHYWLQREWSNQTKSCLDNFTPSGTTAAASFTQSPSGGNAVSFNAGASSSSPGGVAEYVWQFNDSTGGGQNTTLETTSPVFTHTFPARGTYLVALTVMNADGTSYGTAHFVTAGFTAPTAAFTPANGLEGAPMTFSGAGSTDPNAGGSLTYAWNFGDGSTATGASASHAFHAGLYNVQLTVTDSASGLTNSVSHGLAVLDEVPSASFSAPSGRAGTPLTFAGSGSDPDGTISSYSWSFGDGASASGAGARHAYGRAGTYTVTLRATDSSGQSASVSHSVRVNRAACVVPHLTGDPLAKARRTLQGAQCSMGKARAPRKPRRSPGKHKKWVLVVSGQKPAPGSVKSKGAAVALSLTWKSVHN